MFFTNTLRAVALLLVLCLSPVANATCRSTLHYVNGVLNDTRTEAEFITEALQKELKDDPNLCVGEPLFNPSQKMLMDLAETYKLKLDLGKNLWLQIKDGFVAGLLQAFNSILAMVRGEKTDIYGYKADLESMYAKLKPELMAGNGHVLLPHSEGNLLAIRLREMAVADGYSADKIAIMHVESAIFGGDPELYRAHAIAFGQASVMLDPYEYHEVELADLDKVREKLEESFVELKKTILRC